MEIIKYTNKTEKQKIISEQKAKGLILVEIANVKEGNFLGFKEPDEIKPTVIQPSIETKFMELEAKLDEVL
jgi:hypothetical protein